MTKTRNQEQADSCCPCGCGTDVNCRVFEYNGQTYEVPPKEMIAHVEVIAVDV